MFGPEPVPAPQGEGEEYEDGYFCRAGKDEGPCMPLMQKIEAELQGHENEVAEQYERQPDVSLVSHGV